MYMYYVVVPSCIHKPFFMLVMESGALDYHFMHGVPQMYNTAYYDVFNLQIPKCLLAFFSQLQPERNAIKS